MHISDNDQWPEWAIPISEDEKRLALETVRKGAPWAPTFTLAGLAEVLVPVFDAGWCLAAVAHALQKSPTDDPYEYPALGSDDVAQRIRAWSVPPLIGRELGIALAAEFGRYDVTQIRDTWAEKAVPGNKVQAYQAATWIRHTFGWSTILTLTELVDLLVPWFMRGWCPASVRWAMEHTPTRSYYPEPPSTALAIEKRLEKWAKEKAPPIEGAPWSKIVEVRRTRLEIQRPTDEAAVARWQQRQADRSQRWRYRRSLPGQQEWDSRIAARMRSLADVPMPSPPEIDFARAVSGERLCACMEYFVLPGNTMCVPCSKRAGQRLP